VSTTIQTTDGLDYVASFKAAEAAAFRRLAELAALEPPAPRRRARPLKLAVAVAAWAMVVFLVADTRLYGSLGI
jgi:hypothetical protein